MPQESETCGMSLLSVCEVKKHFGHVPALRGISLDVQPGEFVVLVGPNGAGKSTLMGCAAMALRPSTGTILFRGESIYTRANEFRRAVGYISHQLFLYEELSGSENLAFYSRLYGIKPDRAVLAGMMHSFGLSAARDRPVRTYSRGMKQRLAITRAILHQPELILMDEPFSGLDQHASSALRDLLLRLKGEGRTVVMVSHHLEHALQMGDRILILVQGRIRGELAVADTSFDRLKDTYLNLVAQFSGG